METSGSWKCQECGMSPKENHRQSWSLLKREVTCTTTRKATGVELRYLELTSHYKLSWVLDVNPLDLTFALPAFGSILLFFHSGIVIFTLYHHMSEVYNFLLICIVPHSWAGLESERRLCSNAITAKTLMTLRDALCIMGWT